MVLSVISQLAGCFFAVGCFFLLWKQKIFIDVETREIVEVKLPFGLRVKTHAPVLVIFVLAVALILVPIFKAPEGYMVALKGHVQANDEVKVYAIAAEQETRGDVLLQVPANALYTVVYLPKTGATQLTNQTVDLKNKNLREFPLENEKFDNIPNYGNALADQKPLHTESLDVVAGFK